MPYSKIINQRIAFLEQEKEFYRRAWQKLTPGTLEKLSAKKDYDEYVIRFNEAVNILNLCNEKQTQISR